MYKSLEEGLGQCFPYRQDPLPCKILAEKIHLAPDSLKYRVFVEKRKQRKLIMEDGKKPDRCIPKIPTRDITMNDVDRTVGLRDFDMMKLADAILAKEANIKSNKLSGGQ